jgi:hypothetical protein
MRQPVIEVIFADAAREIRQDLARQHNEMTKIGLTNKRLSSHIGKYDGTFARLCLLWHCIEHPGAEPLPEVVEACAQKVAKFLSQFLFPHAVAFYADVYGLSDDHDRLTAVAGYILAHKVEQLTNRIIQRGDRSMRGLKRREIEDICHQLAALGWVTEAQRRRVTDPPCWIVNPEAHRLYQERAEQEAARRRHERELLASIFSQPKEEAAAA